MDLGALGILHDSLDGARNYEKAIANENVSWMQVPEGHHGELFTVLSRFSAKFVRFALLNISVVLILNAQKLINIAK